MLHLLSLFSGIGAFEKALDNIGADYRLINYCEIDRYAAGAFARVHGVSEDLNLRDVTTVDPASVPRVDLITYGFPCQDISVAGRQRGFVDSEGNSTRSGLFFEALRIIRGCRPLYAIAENVKALTSKKFKEEFKTVLDGLAAEGYVNYWAVLNAKDYGVPQNRERVFIVSIRADADMGVFKFPEKIPLTRHLKDVLEDDVPEKFYISSDKAQRLLESLNSTYRSEKESDQIVLAGAMPGFRQNNRVIDPSGVSPTLTARDYKDPCRVLVGGLCLDATVGFDGVPRVYEDTAPTLRAGRSGLMVVEDEPKIMQVGNFVTTGNFRNPQRGRVYDPAGLSPTLNTAQGGDTMPHIIEPVCAASRGRNPENPGDRTPGAETEQRLEVNREGLCNTITTVQKDNYILEPAALRPERTEYGKQIRKSYENGEITEKRSNMCKLAPRDDGITNTLTTVQKDNLIIEPAISKVGNIDGHETGAVLSPDGLCKTLKASDYKNPVKTLVPADPLIVGSLQKNAAVKSDGVAPCLTASMGLGGGQTPVLVPFTVPFRIRKLTPRECWRLQGFTDEDFDRAATGASNSQLYKMAGNSIAVPCLEAIFRNLLEGQHALLEVINDSI